MQRIILSTFFSAALAVTASAQTVNQRRENQQDRIAQGVKSGQLTAGETARVERREAHINHEVRRDRAANGGHLTAGERSHVNHQLNRTSRAIHRDKHNLPRQ